MDIAIVDETLTEYIAFSERDTLIDVQRGEADGQREFPPSHQTGFSPHEMARINEARAALNKYTRRLREAFDRIEEEITTLTVERETEYVSRKDALVDQKNASLTKLKQIRGPAGIEWRTLAARLTDSVREYQEQEFRTGRPPRVSFADPLFGARLPWLTPYTLILGILAVLEMPINQVGVRIAFEFSEFMSYVVALFIGVTFVMFAHFLGMQLNRSFYRHAPRRALNITASVVIVLLAMVLIFVLYKMRGQVVDLTATGLSANAFRAPVAAPPAGNWFSSMLQGLLEIFPWVGPTQLGSAKYAQFGLLLLNVMVFATGTLFSVGRHDPDQDLERAWSARRDAERKMAAMTRRYEAEQAHLEAEYANKITVAERRADTISAEIAKLNATRDRLLTQSNNDMRLVLDALTRQITAYQKGNLSVRKSRSPAYFGHPGLLTLGDNLAIG